MAKLGWAMLFCVLTAGLTSCKGKKRDVLFIAPELQPLIAKFVEDGEKYGAKVTIANLSAQLTERLEFPVVGDCTRNGDYPMIRISKSFWETASEANRQLEIYHELGHCILNREHDDAVIAENGNIPRSIMNTVEIDISVFLKNQDYYFCELFSVLTGATCASTSTPSSLAKGL